MNVMKRVMMMAAIVCAMAAKAQKVESIYFNLYTDSLKKGVYNYISVDGKYSNGKFLPLMSDEVEFSSTAGRWEGNSIVIDTGSKIDSVVITALLKENPSIKKAIAIYIKKKEEDTPLKSEEELLGEWQKKKKKSKEKKEKPE